MNDWNPANTNLQLIDGIWQTSMVLNPGDYQYQLVMDGKWLLDPNNPNKARQ
jgi:cyclomaltodextrinase / maltogenic alpha-amylase / neopullulanase